MSGDVTDSRVSGTTAMLVANVVLEKYFTPQFPNFWRWAGEQQKEIECARFGNPLIVFREELGQVLKELVPQGWPALTSVVLVCLASRENWPQSRKWVQRHLTTATELSSAFIEELASGLDRVHALPLELRSTVAAKVAILRMVFEGADPMMGPARAAEGLEHLNSVLPFQPVEKYRARNLPNDPTSDGEFIQETIPLRAGLKRIDAEALSRMVQTGIVQEVVAAPIPELEEPKTYQGRLAAWLSDPELEGLARIAARLFSVFSWPRGMSEPETVSMGGVSDLTNRGSLDRLLLSELALDDDTLAVRIAMNEAMYLRRESATTQPPEKRMILLDTGLRMWGRPRVYGAAVALAVAAAQDAQPNLTVTVDAMDRMELKRVDLTKRAGGVELLACLSPTLDPGDAIEKWLEEPEFEEGGIEPVLVTTPETFREASFQVRLQRLPTELYVALVDGEGGFELLRRSAQGWRSMTRIMLDLEELLTPRAEGRVSLLTDGDVAGEAAAINRVTPFPLRLPHPIQREEFWTVSEGTVISLGSCGRVLHWDWWQHGPRQLGVGAPTGRVKAWWTEGEVSYGTSRIPELHARKSYAVVEKNQLTLIQVDLGGESCSWVPLARVNVSEDGPVQVLIRQEGVFLIQRRKITVCSLETGEKLAEEMVRTNGELKFQGNRYLSDATGTWYRLSYDGALRLEREKITGFKMYAEAPGFAAPLSTKEGFGVELEEGALRKWKNFPVCQPEYVGGFQWDTWVIFEANAKVPQDDSVRRLREYAVWDLSTLASWEWKSESGYGQEDLLHRQALRLVKVRQNLRTKFREIWSEGDGVYLRSENWKVWRLVLAAGVMKLVRGEADVTVRGCLLERVKTTNAIGTQVAKLPDGNRVVLDSRGLLHLIPAQRAAREVTLVLDENQISGWIDDGRVFGSEYYVGEGNSVPAEQAWRELVAPFFGVSP